MTGTYVYPIRVGESIIHKRGIFATRDIKTGEIVEKVPLLKFSLKDINKPSKLFDYLLQDPESENAMFMLGYGSLYNDSSNKINARWENYNKDNDYLDIVAIKDIAKGDEIYVSYGENYWKSRGVAKI
jgi:SET domain-containing protein